MGIAAWLVPALLSLVGTGISAGVSASSANKQLAQQEQMYNRQQEEQERTANIQRIQNDLTQRMNNQNVVDQFNRNMNSATSTNVGNTSVGGMSVQGLNGTQGYLNNEETNYAKCGGRFKRLFGGKNKVDRASIFVSPNNIPVKTDSNNVVQYRDRLAQMRLGGR